MYLKNKYATWVEINLNAIENNIHYFMEKLGMSVMAIVKANAYGHGLIQVGRTAEQSGVSWLGVPVQMRL